MKRTPPTAVERFFLEIQPTLTVIATQFSLAKTVREVPSAFPSHFYVF
jgi:hypothetical protein